MDASPRQRRAGRRLVVAHLRRHNLLATPGPVPERATPGGTGLALGFAGVSLRPDGAVEIDGHECRPEPRRLAHLLPADGSGGLFFADRAALARWHQEGYDPVLYQAYRNFLPPRHNILADLVVYLPGVLPGGEPHRSTGHWNLPGQLEIFQTLTGRVAMLVAGHTSSGRRFLYHEVCGPGGIVAVPFGAWHVTYVLAGPAAVFNVTTMVDAGAAGSPGAHTGPEKYRRAGPVQVTARWRDGRHDYVGTSEARREWGHPGKAPDAGWLRPWLRPGTDLADLHLYAAPARLAALQQAALAAYAAEWPLDRSAA